MIILKCNKKNKMKIKKKMNKYFNYLNQLMIWKKLLKIKNYQDKQSKEINF